MILSHDLKLFFLFVKILLFTILVMLIIFSITFLKYKKIIDNLKKQQEKKELFIDKELDYIKKKLKI